MRELAGPSSRADDDPEVTQFYVNPIAKPIPQGRNQSSLQDTISDLNMHKPARNGLEVSHLPVIHMFTLCSFYFDLQFCLSVLS